MGPAAVNGYRLSPQQERIWSLRKGERGDHFRSACRVRIVGDLDLEAIAAAARRAVERHEILRTVFRRPFGSSNPVQVILDEPTLAFRSVDMKGREAGEQKIWLQQLQEEANAPFDLENGPLLRCILARLAPTDNVLYVTLHSLCGDGMTLLNLVDQMGRTYSSMADDEEPLQYADLAEFFNELLEAEEMAPGRKYWLEKERSEVQDRDLPFDRTNSSLEASEVQSAAVAMGGALMSHFDDYVKIANASLSTLLLSAWATVLWRLTGRSDLTISVACEGRAYEGLAEALGLFARSLPLSCRLAPELSFAELMVSLEGEISKATQWQGSFTWKLLEESGALDVASSRSFFGFSFLEARSTERYDDLNFVIERLDSMFDSPRLELIGSVTPDRLELRIQSSSGFCPPAEAQRLLGQLTTLLENAIANPRRRLIDLPSLSPVERHQILFEFNDTDVFLSAEQRLHKLVLDQCRRTPDRIAAVEDGSFLTFAALDSQAGRIADELVRRGIETDEVVGVFLDRSLEMVVSILGVLKAGAAYLPLAPDYPHDRLAFMIADARPRWIVTQRHLRPNLEPTDVPILSLDGEWRAEPFRERSQDHRLGTAGTLAYVIYTSGSTGRPKGVAVSHSAIGNRLLWMQRRFPIGEDDAVVFKTAFTFDASIWELFVPLLAGACVIVARSGGQQDSRYLVRLVLEHQAAVLQLVPSMLRIVVEEPELSACTSLLRLFCGGEAFPGELQRRFEACHTAALHNLYGPTEAAIDATHWVCQPGDAPTYLPLGRPLSGVRIYILGPRLADPALRGVAGELCIGGRGLARGYHGRPDLTAERFVPDGQSGCWGERLYRTGDRVRFRASGVLEFLGRIDQQIKIRGYRVELGEIEVSLERHRGVARAAVELRSNEKGDRLIAYVVPRAEALDAAELRTFLAESLPDYMIPSAVVVLPALPLLPNGKLDRKALQEFSETDGGRSREAPQSLTQEVLCGIWSDVLGVGDIGIRDSFFDLGGHSISATQMAARVRAAFGVDLTLRAVFDHPTIVEIAEAIEVLRSDSRARSLPPMVTQPRNLPLPLSFAQRRLWFLDQLQPGNAAYNVGLAFSLAGRLSLPILTEALNAVLRRHEVLRTTFALIDGEPMQMIAPGLKLTLPLVDLAGLETDRRERIVARLASAVAGLPFDLGRGPLVRVLVARGGAVDHTAVIALHHIVTDGWSTGILLRELAAFYPMKLRRSPIDLPDLPIQYADFAYWQRQWLQGEELNAQLAYWRSRLEALSVLQLPTDRPRPPLQSFRGAAQAVILPARVVEHLALIGRRNGASLFMVLVAAFSCLLARLSGSRDIAIGVPIAGRSRPEVEGLVGLFVNTLVLRADLNGKPGLETVIEKIREAVLGASVYQYLPFEQLVESLQLERDLSQNPIFQVMLILQNFPQNEIEIEGLTLRTLPVKTGTAKLDLSLDLMETANGLVGAFEYNSDLFEPTTIERWGRHFTNILESGLDSPDRSFSELDMLSEGERRQILERWNETGVSYRLLPLHQLIEEQVARSPEAPALVFEGERLSYAAMNRRAELWARHLRNLGTRPDMAVGICAERSMEMVIGMLAILKAGGAYLPLDPTLPLERLAFMMRDAGLRLVLTQERLLGRLPKDWDGRYLSLEGDAPTDTGIDVPAVVDLANLAYIIYTSGSTGFPKGVMISHGGIGNRLLWMQNAYRLSPEDRVLQKTPYTFDVSVWEFFWPLLVGATLVIARPGGHMDGSYLASLIAAEKVTTLHFVPSMLQVFLEEPKAAECRSLRLIICSGEALPVELANRCLSRFAPLGVELHNLYGPTEASVDVSFWECRPAERLHTTPIGRPIANSRLFIVDAEGTPVPVGVPGELLIGGDGLGRGYLGRADLTAERFVPDPLGADLGGRLYRTGDLSRFLSDGDIEFRGRIDFQVKIRGFRIELGEIESVLERHAGVLQAVAVAFPIAGDPRLVAYVVSEEGSAPTQAELREYLAVNLPDYMIPAAIVLVPAFPLSPNGKVDRRALPAPGALEPGESDDFAMPRTPIEEILAGLWQQLLGRERVGRNESFFQLGGHSLLATQVLSRLRDNLGVELPLRTFFEGPSIAELAVAIERARGGQQPPLPPLRPSQRQGVVPLSFAQERVWFIEQLVTDNPVYNISAILGLSGDLDVPSLAASFSEIVRRHEALRTIFLEVAGEAMQRVGPMKAVAIPVIDLGGLAEPIRTVESHHLQVAEARRPFDLESGPLLRVRLLRLDRYENLVLFTVHHIVSDAWSMNIFGRELAAHYAALLSGSQDELPELPIQYADYAAWQRAWLTDEVLERELSFLGERLTGLPNLDLPTDRPRPPLQTYHGDRRSRVLPADTLGLLQALGSASGTTPFMALLSVFEALMGRYSGQESAGVGVPIANRRRTEVEPLIGFFVNMLVLRMDLSGEPTCLDLLKRVRATALDAFMHQDIPFEVLVSHLRPERDLSRNPLVQVAFQLLHSPGDQSVLPGLTLTRPQQRGAVVRFDLELVASEVGGRLLTHLDYCSDLFEEATAERMLGHFENLVTAFLEDSSVRLSELALLSEAEREQLLLVWNDPKAAFPSDDTLHGLFEAQAAVRPKAPAALFELDEMSYGELNAAANRLAHHLRGLGVGPETLVGVWTERSVGLIVGLLGVLKAGGAYVPLDPANPRDRLTYMMDDAGISVLLAQRSLVGELPRLVKAFVDIDDPGSWKGSTENPSPSVTAENLAYVIYTSGSTGQPKGVMVTHEQVIRLFAATRKWFGFDEKDTWALFHSYAFDFSVWELWGALLHGGRLVVVPYWASRSPEAFHKLVAGEGVTVLNQTPSAFQELARSEEDLGRVDAAGGLRLVIFGGEALNLSTLRPWIERHGQSKPLLVNMYGITETTVHVTYRPVSSVDLGSDRSPVGVPIPDLRVHLVDRALQLVPLGVPGELLVGGSGVARGYLGRPELTAKRFLPDPFEGAPGARVYRSGDLARRSVNGELEYLGRIDHQVKIRGFRIELGEIAARLAQHPGVENVLVNLHADPITGPQIVAYLVPYREHGLGPELISELRSLARQHLPDYMVPAAFVLLDEIPLTANGKADRRALAALRVVTEDAVHTTPRTPMEAVIAGVWCELLNRERVGVEESFFDLGGHSLLASRAIGRIGRIFHVDVPLRTIFETPTVGGLAEHVRQLLEEGETPPSPPISPVPRDRDLPLSFAQQRIWFLDQLMPGSFAYNMPVVIRFHGGLGIETFGRCLTELVARHETLRTTFQLSNGQPVQIIAPPSPCRLPLIDLRALPADGRNALSVRLARQEVERPFDLGRGPLLRFALVRVAEDRNLLILAIHHIVCDGWSMGIFVRETIALYRSFTSGDPSPFAPLSLQFADFADWQRRWLSGASLEAHLAYWRRQLGDDPPPLDLPTDRPRPLAQTNNGKSLSLAFSPALTMQLKDLARGEGATPFLVLLSAFKVLLARYSGQEDLTVGAPVAGRNRIETEGMIGLFINTLAMRTDLGGRPSFQEVVRRVRDVSLAALAYQDLPFEKLVEELRPRRSLNRSPFFQVLFNLQNTPESTSNLPGLDLEFIDLESRSSKFDLSLSLSERLGTFGGSLEFNSDLFDSASAQRLVGHLETLLGNAVAMPEHPFPELGILPPSERRQLVQEASDGGSRIRPSCLHELFEEQVRFRPDASAVAFQGGCLTYRELNERADHWARRLRSCGVGPEVYVGICVDRSLEMLLGLLAVLKAGGAYLPMDPTYPASRLAYMIEDARVSVVLTRGGGASSPFPASSAIVVDLDETLEITDDRRAGRPIGIATPQNLAYVIYTSGSTGQPKGVQISHLALVNFLDSMVERLGISSGERFGAVTSLSFDIAGLELFLPLLAGAEVVIVDRETASDGLALRRLLSDREITLMQATPSTWRMLTESGWEGRSSLKILCGGEALAQDLARSLAVRGASLWNMYGPTETTIWSAMSSVSVADRTISLGRPIANTQIHCLDRDLELVPYNVAGEVYIGGEGLSRGYLGRSALTAERFIPDPYGTVPGARLYKTGDLSRRSARGDIEFLGRLDFQVKVRGYRIELGEIEAALHQHPAVRDTVVLAREDGGGTHRLVAYWVPREGLDTTVSELLAHVRSHLPEQMVPAIFIRLESLPLTPNGKVDRQALPDSAGERPDLAIVYVPPSNEAEQTIVRIWQEALQIEQIGIHDNFFDLGGHSLLIVQVQGRLVDAFQVEVPVIELFRHSTVASLAGFMNRQRPEEVRVEEGLDRAEKRRAAMARRGRTVARSGDAEVEP